MRFGLEEHVTDETSLDEKVIRLKNYTAAYQYPVRLLTIKIQP